MINAEYIQMMARYSSWQNGSITQAAAAIEDAERHKERGSFFGSIQATMNHLLWGDRIWMHRFAETDKPRMGSIAESVNETGSWVEYCEARAAMDTTITDWAQHLDPAWLQGDLTWFSTAVNRSFTKPRQSLVVHFFNHGTHHRGQLHTMLTSAGQTLADTDLPLMPDGISDGS